MTRQDAQEFGAEVKPVGRLKLSQLTESESLHSWPRCGLPTRANEHLIIGLELPLSTIPRVST